MKSLTDSEIISGISPASVEVENPLHDKWFTGFYTDGYQLREHPAYLYSLRAWQARSRLPTNLCYNAEQELEIVYDPAASTSPPKPVAWQMRVSYGEDTVTPGWQKWEDIDAAKFKEINEYIENGYSTYQTRELCEASRNPLPVLNITGKETHW